MERFSFLDFYIFHNGRIIWKKVEKCWFYVEMLKQSWLYVETMLIMYVDFSFQHWKIVDVEKVKSDSKCWKSVEKVWKEKLNQVESMHLN